MLQRLLVAIFAFAALALAQSSSSNLLPTSLSTNAFTPPNTFTPVTTFNSATSPVPTFLTGVGPSVAPGSASFSYNIPTGTVTGYAPTSVYASLASAGLPTDATGAIVPPNSPDLIINNVNAAANVHASATVLASVLALSAFLLA